MIFTDSRTYRDYAGGALIRNADRRPLDTGLHLWWVRGPDAWRIETYIYHSNPNKVFYRFPEFSESLSVANLDDFFRYDGRIFTNIDEARLYAGTFPPEGGTDFSLVELTIDPTTYENDDDDEEECCEVPSPYYDLMSDAEIVESVIAIVKATDSCTGEGANCILNSFLTDRRRRMPST